MWIEIIENHNLPWHQSINYEKSTHHQIILLLSQYLLFLSYHISFNLVFISKYLDTADFKNGIDYILEDENKYQNMSDNCYKFIKDNFNDDIVSKKFINIYKQLLNKIN